MVVLLLKVIWTSGILHMLGRDVEVGVPSARQWILAIQTILK